MNQEGLQRNEKSNGVTHQVKMKAWDIKKRNNIRNRQDQREFIELRWKKLF